jgi:hypothetical protein
MKLKGTATMETDYERTGRLYPKIDLYVKGQDGSWCYYYSTQQWKRCKDAKISFAAKSCYQLDDVKACFSR